MPFCVNAHTSKLCLNSFVSSLINVALCVCLSVCVILLTHTQRQLALMKVFGCSAVSVQFSLQKIGSGCLNW